MYKEREQIAQAKRIVVKVGTRILTAANGKLESRRISGLVSQMAALRAEGRDIILVTSGAVGSGMEALGLTRRPKAVADLQMAAAVGQSRLMARYDLLFRKKGCLVGQVLLTYDDLGNRRRHLNIRNTMLNLLRHGIIPIVNENDVVATDELKIGDNDVIASRVALLVDADLLILLTSTDGLRAPAKGRRTQRIPHLERVTHSALALAKGKTGELSTGGMSSKLQSAQVALSGGALVVIADGRKPGVLREVLQGKDVGTLIGKAGSEKGDRLTSRKRWIAYFQRPQGSVVIDEGAARAIIRNGHSLLPIGVKRVEGSFARGSLVTVRSDEGTALARGLVEYSSAEIDQIRGKKSGQIESILGSRDYAEVIHRDNLVLEAEK